jgi:hypothetical protein
LSQRSATVSAVVANADAVDIPASWSSSDVTQSPAIAAGVDPPTTKWKNRGPDECVAAAAPIRSSSAIESGEPWPSSGSGPSSPSSSGRLATSRTSRVASPDR